nr:MULTISPECIES: glycosyltransferase family 2 protein [unclassified Moraxella]
MKLITIGIPIYNAEDFLADAIKSILAQSYQNFELILVNDGSKDNSLEIAKDFAKQDSRIRVISDGINKKLPARLNQIIREAKGDYIARMDADDMMHSERIAKQLNFLQCNPQFDLVSTSMISIKNSNEIIGTRTYFPKQITKKDALLGQSGILHASILAKKAWCERNLYNEVNALAEDHELWLSAAINNDLKVGFLPEYLYYYREESSATKKKMLKGYNTQMQIISKYYNSILSEKDYQNIMRKFAAKKMIVNIADAMKMMHIILNRRSKREVSTVIRNEYEKQLNIIQQLSNKS